MKDQLPQARAKALAKLPRTWWFPGLKGFRSTDEMATYAPYPLDEQPPIVESDSRLTWLEEVPEKEEWSLVGDDASPVTPLTTERLHEVVGDVPVPESLAVLARRPELQRRIHSVTGCYLDLGDFVVRTSEDEGRLLHILSDQQWCRHWLVYLDSSGRGAVVTSAEPLGFHLLEDWEEPPPEVVPLDGSFDLEVCADSFHEFLYRFWIENELWSALESDAPLPEPLAAYAGQLPSTLGVSPDDL